MKFKKKKTYFERTLFIQTTTSLGNSCQLVYNLGLHCPQAKINLANSAADSRAYPMTHIFWYYAIFWYKFVQNGSYEIINAQILALNYAIIPMTNLRVEIYAIINAKNHLFARFPLLKYE